LKTLYDLRLLEPIRRRVMEGMSYGASAGSNLACPTIRTTNDMPIVEPPSLAAMNLVPFQINPHYLDVDPASTHMGETRETRIREFLEENTTPVIGLREGAMLRVSERRMQLRGLAGARIFRRDHFPIEAEPGSDLSDYLMNSH
jgi:dipeptidase E